MPNPQVIVSKYRDTKLWIVVCSVCGVLNDDTGSFWLLKSNAAKAARAHRRAHR